MSHAAPWLLWSLLAIAALASVGCAATGAILASFARERKLEAERALYLLPEPCGCPRCSGIPHDTTRGWA